MPARPPSGVALLFTPRNRHQSHPEAPSPAQQAEAARLDAITATQAAAEARIAALQSGWQAERARIESAHAEALATLETRQFAMISALEEALAQALPALALTVARAALGAEPSSPLIASLAAEAVAALPEAAAGTLRIATGQPHPQLPGWSVVEDASLPPATVHAEVDATRITATLDLRLEQMARELTA